MNVPGAFPHGLLMRVGAFGQPQRCLYRWPTEHAESQAR